MDAYEQVIYLYSSMHEAYGWTRRQISEEELSYVLDLLVTLSKVRSGQEPDSSQEAYIDEVF